MVEAVAEGVLIRPIEPRLSLAELLAAYVPMAGQFIAAEVVDG